MLNVCAESVYHSITGDVNMYKRLLILITILILLTNLTYAETLIQTHVDEAPYSTNTNTGQYGLIFDINTTGYKLINVTYITGHSHLHSCLYNYSNSELLKCCDITVNTASCFDYEMAKGNIYFVAGLRNGSVQATKYKNPGSYPYYATESTKILNWSSGYTLGSTFPPNPADFTPNSFWISVEHMDFETISGGGGGESNKDYLKVVNYSHYYLDNSSIGLHWDTEGNYSYSEIIFNGELRYNGSANTTLFTDLVNNTNYWFNLTVYWNTSIFNTSQYNVSTNQTIQFRLNEIWAYNILIKIEKVVDMLEVILIWLIMNIFALWVLRKIHYLTGVLIWFLNLPLDMWLLTTFITSQSAIVSLPFYQLSYGMLNVYVAIFLVIKVLIPFVLREE